LTTRNTQVTNNKAETNSDEPDFVPFVVTEPARNRHIIET